jgi:hypothetical protein
VTDRIINARIKIARGYLAIGSLCSLEGRKEGRKERKKTARNSVRHYRSTLLQYIEVTVLSQGVILMSGLVIINLKTL